MRTLSKHHDPPLGVHIYPGGIAIVATEMRNGAPAIKGTRNLHITPGSSKPVKQQQIELIRQALEEIKPSTKTAILSVAPDQTMTKRFHIEGKLKERHIIAAAGLEADELFGNLVESERIMALDPLPETLDRLLSVARKDSITELLQIAKDAGLHPVAIDVPIAAWQRTISDRTDVVLDLTYERPMLYIFGIPIGEQKPLHPKLRPEQLAVAVRSSLVLARRSNLSEARKLLIVGKYDGMNELIAALTKEGDLDASVLQLGTEDNPGWAYAAALSTWGIQHATAILVRANLLPVEETGNVVFGVRIQPRDLVYTLMSNVAVGLALLVFNLSMTSQSDILKARLNAVNDQLAGFATETNIVGRLSSDVHRLEEIDRDSVWLRNIGQATALRMTYIGNAVPPDAWIEEIHQDRMGWTILGNAKSLKGVSNALKQFAKASPELQTSYSNISTDHYFGFKVNISEPRPDENIQNTAIKPLGKPSNGTAL